MRSPIDLKAADHPVKAVSIFSQTTWSGFGGNTGKAEVLRVFNVELKVCTTATLLAFGLSELFLQEGENRVHIHGLSSNIDRDSARVSGLSEDIRVFDVVCSLKPQQYPADNDIQEALRRLRKKKEILEQLKLCARIRYYVFTLL